jgi:putative restriction endonuclease
MHLRIAITDNHWFRFLRARPGIDEVNFWKPGGRQGFRALDPGELLLFKLHSPEDYIVGGGVFLHFTFLPYTLAWETFQEKNGVASLDEMRRRIEHYRHESVDLNARIGCILLREPFFFPNDLWIPSPPDFGRSIQQGKNFDTASGTGRWLWEQITARLPAATVAAPGLAAEPRPIFGDPRLYRPRLGQGTFRILVTDNYQRRCAVTGEKALPVLDAAHIRPVTEGGQHRLDNGLLLRTDVHRLYDNGYVTVTPDGRFLVSHRLKTDFDNGEPYMPFHGQKIWMPGDPVSRPDREALEWHSEAVFLR